MSTEQIELANRWNWGLWPEEVYDEFIGSKEWITDLSPDDCLNLMCFLVLASGH